MHAKVSFSLDVSSSEVRGLRGLRSIEIHTLKINGYESHLASLRVHSLIHY